MRLKTLLASLLIGSALVGTVAAGAAWAWGSSGHRMIGEIAFTRDRFDLRSRARRHRSPGAR